MSRPLSIGLLTPYSGIYPHYSSYLVTGWLTGMGLDPVQQSSVQFVQEYTGMGSAQSTEAAARKLLFFNRVDVLSGLVSYKTVPSLLPLIEKEKRPAFFFDMGEYIPHFPYLSPDVFYVSLQLWQSQYALGYWAQQQFGSGGHLIMPVYEAGYHLNSSFQQGVFAAGGTGLQATILPFDHNNPQRMELEHWFAQLAKDKPAYVHAIFCGSLGNRFLQAWIERGFHKTIPLVVNECMAYDDMLDDVKHFSLDLYTSRIWMREDERPANRLFVKQFESIARQPANIYALLGYEAGLIWKELLPHAQKQDWDAVKQQLRNGIIQGPSGEKNFYPASGFALPVSNIIKIRTTGESIQKIIVDQGKGMSFHAPAFAQVSEQNVSGWQNPFLCI